MSTVLIIGATGYIGNAVARAFRREGVKVYGLTRSAAKAGTLAGAEIIPLIVSDPLNTDSYKKELAEADVIVNCGADYTFSIQDKLIAAINAATKSDKAASTKKVYIETSGCLCHGHNEKVVTENEDSPTDSPIMLGRREAEQKVIGAKGLIGVVLRPTFVYGGATPSHGARLFEPVPDGEKMVVQGKRQRWSWVHVDDLAEAYVLAAAARDRVAGQLITVGEGTAPATETLMRAGKRFTGETEWAPADDVVSQMHNVTTLISNQKARLLLGWTPKHQGILAELDTLRAAWEVGKGLYKGAGGAGGGAGAGSGSA